MKPNQPNNSKLHINRQTINKLNESAMQKVKGGLQTIIDLSAIQYNCYTGCIPGGGNTIGVYCPSIVGF